MDINMFFKGIIDGDEKPIVISDINHIIVYMNPAAVKNYEKRGGVALIGKSLLDCHSSRAKEIIKNNICRMQADKSVNKIFEFHRTHNGANEDLYCVAIRDKNGNLIGYYEKFEDKNLYKAEECSE